MVAFCRRRHFGGCHCVRLPFLCHGKGKYHHWYTTHGSHQQGLQACGVETVSSSPQAYTHTYKVYVYMIHLVHRGNTNANNSVCLSEWVWMCASLVFEVHLMCVSGAPVILYLTAKSSPPPFPVRNLRRWLVHIFPQLYGLVPSDGAVMCFIDMLQVTL